MGSMAQYELQYEFKRCNDNFNLANDPLASSSMKLDFAKVNIFNPYDQNAYKRIFDRMAERGQPFQKEICRVWRFAVNDTEDNKFAFRTRFNLIEHKGHQRKNKFYYKQFKIHEELSPLAVRAYALRRYRERSGQYLDPAEYWQPLPTLSQAINVDNKTMRQDILLPTKTGAWLGYPCLTTNGYWEYKSKNQQLTLKGEYFTSQFKALTYITRQDMFPWQKEICDLHSQGRYEEANQIQDDNLNPNQIADI